VDDNATNRLIVREALEPCGALASEAEDGHQALAAIRDAALRGEPFRLVLLDKRMPDLDGFDVVERLRDQDGKLHTTVIMLTSENRAGDIARARQLGLAGYLLKPIKRAELLETIARLGGTPLPGAEAPAAPPPPTPTEAGRPLRVLLVEDSADNRLLIQVYLKGLSFQVDDAEDGQEAVERFQAARYDLVLMDMLMPVMDGLEATRAIRNWEQAQGCIPTPIIALTANVIARDVQRCLDAGCTAHLAKPIKKAALLRAIAQHAPGERP
jgi:two-component system sensor histidine kinase/response regulator